MKNCHLWDGKFYNYNSDGLLTRIDIFEFGFWKACQTWNAERFEISTWPNAFIAPEVPKEIPPYYIGTLVHETGDRIPEDCGDFYIKTENEIIWFLSNTVSLMDFAGKKVKIYGVLLDPDACTNTCVNISKIKRI